MNIRMYRNGDFEQLTSLYKNKAAFGGEFDPARDNVEKLQRTAEAGNLYVAEIDGEVVGSIMILDNPHTFWLLRFAVDPDIKQYDEVVSGLDKVVGRTARERGHEDVIVYTNPDDENLLDRYRELGYTESSNYRCLWKGVKE